jgi:hypothetical protein
MQTTGLAEQGKKYVPEDKKKAKKHSKKVAGTSPFTLCRWS